MSAPRKFNLDHRLDAYFSTLHSLSLRERLKRSAGNWQLYAAVTGSAVAMATGASAAIIGSGIRDIRTESIASVLAAKQQLASSQAPMIKAVRLAMAGQNPGQRFLQSVGARIAQATPVTAPSITGIVPIFSTANTIQPGEWVSIYGANLAAAPAFWNGDFPKSLGGTSVEIDGQAAYLEFVSPGQINLQAPDDNALGTVSVVVTTAAGSATSVVTLSRFAPSFSLLDSAHVAGIIPRSDGSGAYGKGAYDILGPLGSPFGYATVAAKPGDIVELYGVGFGPTTPVVLAGEAFSGAAHANDNVSLYINNVMVKPTFVGLSSAGLFQINLTVPSGLGEGDVPIRAMVGGVETQAGLVFSLQNYSNGYTYPVTGGTIGSSIPPSFFTPGTTAVPPDTGGGTGGATNGGGTGGGTGGGSAGASAVRKRKPYEPTLQFPPK